MPDNDERLIKNKWYNFENNGIDYHYKNNDSDALHIYFNGYSVTEEEIDNLHLENPYTPMQNSLENYDYFSNDNRKTSAVIPEMYYDNITDKGTDAIDYIEKVVHTSCNNALGEFDTQKISMGGGSYGAFNALVGRAIVNKDYNLEDKINYVSLYFDDNSYYKGNPYETLKEGQSKYTTESLKNTIAFVFGDYNNSKQSCDLIRKDLKEIINFDIPTTENSSIKTAMNSNIIDLMSTGNIDELNLDSLKNASISILFPDGSSRDNCSVEYLKNHFYKLETYGGDNLDLIIINPSSSEKTIGSDSDILSENIININNSLMNSILNKTSFSKDSYGSTTDVPSEEPNILINMLNSFANLFKKINYELNTLSEVGAVYASMDEYLTNVADNLDKGLSPLNPNEGNTLSSNNLDYQETNNSQSNYGGVG